MNNQSTIEQNGTPLATKVPSKRPVIITGYCIFLFVFFPVAVWQVVSGAYNQGPSWFPAFVFLSQLVACTCVVGLWLMRRWAIMVYACFFPISQVAIFVSGFWTPITFIAPICFLALGLAFYRRMK